MDQLTPHEIADRLIREHVKSKISREIPECGQLHVDAFGNQATIFPDGRIEPVESKTTPKKES